MKKILVPCDFSKTAINAFRFALDIAHKSKGVIHLLHVIEIPVMYDTVLMPALNFEQELYKELKVNAEQQFINMLTKYNTEQVKVSAHVEYGTTASTLLDYTEKESIDLIVMGSHGTSGLHEVFVGSNAEKIVRRARVPVLVVKEFFKGKVTDIVFPNTLELGNQEDLLMAVKGLQEFFNAKLHLLWINTPLNFTSDTVTLERLEAFAKRFLLKNYSIHVFNHLNEEEGILQFSKLIKADMIAMATHGRKGLAHILNGSLAESVVNHTDQLIWTYTLRNETDSAL